MSKSYLSSSRIQSDSVCNFIEKTYEILETKDNQAIISWSSKGTSFVVKDVLGFSNSVLPKYFKHSNFSSFVRQLNMYNFHKVRGDKFENQFEHSKFRKGHRQLLAQIRRKGNEQSSTMIEADKGQTKQEIQPPKIVTLQSRPNIQQDNGIQLYQVNRNLQILLSENRKLKRQKNRCLAMRKQLTQTENLIDQKFYKFVTTLIAHKIKDKLGIPMTLSDPEHTYGLNSFSSIVDHITSGDKVLSYEYYDVYSKLILDKCREEWFVLGMGEEEDPQIPSIEFIVDSQQKI